MIPKNRVTIKKSEKLRFSDFIVKHDLTFTVYENTEDEKLTHYQNARYHVLIDKCLIAYKTKDGTYRIMTTGVPTHNPDLMDLQLRKALIGSKLVMFRTQADRDKILECMRYYGSSLDLSVIDKDLVEIIEVPNLIDDSKLDLLEHGIGGSDSNINALERLMNLPPLYTVDDLEDYEDEE